ncbi:MAG TPA: hypothetical protein VGE07_02235 [Herpetosiphonaceae bacterium]
MNIDHPDLIIRSMHLHADLYLVQSRDGRSWVVAKDRHWWHYELAEYTPVICSGEYDSMEECLNGLARYVERTESAGVS